LSLPLLYLLTFLESVGTGILQRGIYFYTHERLGFGQLSNSVVALAYGVLYVAGALASHSAATRWGEKKLLVLTLFGLLATHAAMAASPNAWILCAGFVLSAKLRGLMWPVFESYVSAGRTPRQLLPVLGGYNVSWALAMPLAVGVSGPLISSSGAFVLFALPAALNVLSLGLIRPLPERPAHLDLTHPERPAAAELERYGRLLVSARWSMLAGYALLFLLAPLMPDIFHRLDLGVAMATPAAALFDAVRWASFVVLGRTGAAWRGRAFPLGLTAVLMPAGFLLVLFGPSLGAVLFGELLFGGASGFAYTAALYYALVVKNASVDAGGAHEGLIGLGLGLGPLVGIVGYELAGQRLSLGGAELGYVTGMLLAIAPLLSLCAFGALRPLPRVWHAPLSPAE
jgi:predicted MFS family arabinose efflux permease